MQRIIVILSLALNFLSLSHTQRGICSARGMDAELSRIFAATLNPDRCTRDAAEAALYQLSLDPTLPVTLLQFATSADGRFTPSVKLAAACRLRNVLCKANWNRVAYFSDDSKNQIKALVVPALCSPHVDEAIRRQIVASLECIVEYDYPQRWDNLVPQLQQLLGASVAEIGGGALDVCVALRGGLQALRFCCKRYEDVTQFSAEEIDTFALNFLSPLLQLCRTLVDMVSSVPGAADHVSLSGAGKQRSAVTEVYHAMRIAWKCIWSLTDSRWPLSLCAIPIATDFFELLLHSKRTFVRLIRALDLETFAAGGDSEVSCQPLQHIAAWRYAKWLGKLTSRCFSSLGVAPRASEKRARAAAMLLHDSYFAPLAQCALELVKWHDNGSIMVNSKAFILALECTELAVAHQAAYQMHLLPAAEQLLTMFLFRRLRFSTEDAELWSTNPEEYVRKLTDPRGDLFNAKLISMGLIVTLCHARKPFHSQELLMSFVSFLLGRLGALSECIAQGKAEMAGPEYDGCLYAIAQMKKLLAHGDLIDDGKIEWLLSTYVAPLLTCPIGYLRAKAVYLLSLFKGTKWSSPAVYPSIVQAVIPLLSDKDVPVRIQTCVCLSRFIRMDAAREVITPQIGAVVEQYFNIMRLMDNDGVVRTLRRTVAFYGDALAQWATDLCRMLVSHFLTVHEQLSLKHKAVEASEMGDDEDEMVDSLLAADELMETLRTLVQSVPRDEASRATMASMQDTLAPLLQMILSIRQGANLGFMDAALHLISTVVSRSLAIAPSFWSIAALLYHVGLDTSFLDYVEHLVAPLDNFLSVDPRGFLEKPCCTAPDGVVATCGEMTVHLCNAIITNGSSFHHLSTTPKITDAVLLHSWSCGSSSPKTQWVCSQLIQLSIRVLSTRGGSMPLSLQTLFADNILVGIFTMPSMCLPILEQTGAASFIIESIAGLFQHTAIRPSLRSFDRKVFVLSFVSLLRSLSAPDPSLIGIAEILSSAVASSGMVGCCAVEEMRLMTSEVEYHQRRISGKLNDDDDSYDEAWNDSSDDNATDVSGSDLDEGDDDGDSEVSEDGCIRNDAQFSSTLAQASKLRESALGEDFDDGEENFLDDDDFETPIDEANVWEMLLDAMGQCHRVDTFVDPRTRAAVVEASQLFTKCAALRHTKVPSDN